MVGGAGLREANRNARLVVRAAATDRVLLRTARRNLSAERSRVVAPAKKRVWRCAKSATRFVAQDAAPHALYGRVAETGELGRGTASAWLAPVVDWDSSVLARAAGSVQAVLVAA